MGQSSFTAHSAFAIDLAQTVVGSTQLTGGNREVETLLGMLNHIRTAFTETHDPTSHLFPLIQGPISSAECQMPPLSTVVQLLQKSQGKYSSGAVFERIADNFPLQMKDASCFLAYHSCSRHEVCRIYA